MTITTPTSFTLGRTCFAAGALFFVLNQHIGPALSDVPDAPPAVATLAGPALVVDGDTIEIDGKRLRLDGIDAPETAQTCTTADGAVWPCGRAAAKVLARLLSGADAACDSRGTDKYGRMLAVCFAEGRDLNAAMVQSGYAWAFIKYSTRYVAEEAAARGAHLGVWQGPAEAPWDFRHNGWQSAEVQAPGGCAIKGNVSSKGHIYHMPWSPWYARVTVEAKRGEQWFCSEAEALAAGWRPALTN